MRNNLLRILLLLISAPALVPAQSNAATNAQKPAQKTMEQVFKNIQSLKGKPADQLVPIMEYFSASLGVQCNFCHVSEPAFAPEKDDKDDKKAARGMIAMMENINQANFEGRPTVGCGTCHGGRIIPASMPPVGDERPPQSPTGMPEPNPKIPNPDQILQKYYAAVGGKAALQNLTTRVTKGSVTTPEGKLAFEIDQKAPNLFVASLTLPNGATFAQGFDGHVGWRREGPGPAGEISGPDLALAGAIARFFDPELSPVPGSINAWVAEEAVNGHDCYVLRPKPLEGGIFERLYFDKQSGLLLRRTLSERTLFGLVPNNWFFSDYRDVNGVKIPFSISQARWDGVLNFTAESVQLNVPVEDAKFQKPTKPTPPVPPGAAR